MIVRWTSIFPYASCLFHLGPQTAVRVHLRLDKSLRLCGANETEADCCPKPLCVLETLQLSACVGSTPQASLLIQAKIHAQLFPINSGSGNSNGTCINNKSWWAVKCASSKSIQFQIMKQLFQTTCTKHLALVRVTSHSEHVMYAAAVTRYLHRSHIKRF